MPTAAKFVAAIVFGFVAWFVSRLMVPYLPEGTRQAYFAEVSTAIGMVMGWRISGRYGGGGMRAGIGYGLTTVAATVFWGLLIFAGEEMLDRSLNVRYDGPIEALTEGVQLFVDYAKMMIHPDVIIWLIVGALFGGWVTERTARNWS
ncbi:TrgA family protein [Frigidibacter sp. ROC022]|uniref:TrgA family protein n=1 Tax=Frigidibacter sp. ROC022 TaxID=2971796 RepID=UPI00215AFEC7|nr:TrgA family protein [Frigidibacter sp. ROC022]MCR8723602.1 TrgA family protein [Frigidibacter sp. ROC022]